MDKIREFPKYTKSQKLNCKLDEKQIEVLRKLKIKGLRNKDIAAKILDRYNIEVSYYMIRYWTNEEFRQSELARNPERKVRWEENNPEKRKESTRRYWVRKWRLMGDRLRHYFNSIFNR